MTYKEFKESEFCDLADGYWLLKDYDSGCVLNDYQTDPIYDDWIIKGLSGEDFIMVVYISNRH